MKQQGWLSKIVPQPKEANGPMSGSKDPGGFLWWWRSKPLPWYDEISMPSIPTRSALPTTRRLLPPHTKKREGKGAEGGGGFRGSGNGWRQAVREMGGGSSDAGASSCLDEANHSLTLARARRKVCVHLAVHHWQSRQAPTGEQFFQGPKAPPLRGALQCSNGGCLQQPCRPCRPCQPLVNDIDRGCGDALAYFCLLKLAPARSSLNFTSHSASHSAPLFRAPSMTDHWHWP
jgi:hypothetical protein